MTNSPSFTDFIAEKIGHRAWYTAPRRRPSIERRKGLSFVSQKVFDAISDEYTSLFGINPRTGLPA